MGRLITVDIDLHRVHAWDATLKEVVCVDSELGTLLQRLETIQGEVTLLVECGSTHTYGGKLLKKKQAWLIFNSVAVGKLAVALRMNEYLHHVNMLVSPSSTWTHGYNEARRHLMAKTKPQSHLTKDQNHNIEECQAMAHFYGMCPDDWKPLTEYLQCL